MTELTAEQRATFRTSAETTQAAIGELPGPCSTELLEALKIEIGQ